MKRKLRITQEQAIEKANRTHPNSHYTYGKYEGNKALWKITCHKKDKNGKEHGVFVQTFNAHTLIENPQNCPKCWKERQTFALLWTQKEFVEEAEKIWGNYYKPYGKYNGMCNKMKATCPIHGEIDIIPNNHLNNCKCNTCAYEEAGKKRRLDVETFKSNLLIKNPFAKYLDLSKIDYKGNKVKIFVGCKKCKHWWWARPDNLNNGNRCPCCYKTSKGEHKIQTWLEKEKVKFEHNKWFEDCRGLSRPLLFDYYLPEYNLCVEFDGRQHFDKKSKYYSKELIKNDKNKNRYCKKHNINILRIPHWDFKNIEIILENHLKGLK